MPIIELNKVIEQEIISFRPDAVFTHFEFDANHDHRLVYRSVCMATRPGAKHLVGQVICFETPSSTEWNFNAPFQPNYFEQLSQRDVEMKWQSLACYESEIRDYPHPRSEEGITILAKYRGMQAGVEYAEAFQIIRNIAK